MITIPIWLLIAIIIISVIIGAAAWAYLNREVTIKVDKYQ